MAKTLKQLLLDEKRKSKRIKSIESDLAKEKKALDQIKKAIPAQRKKEGDQKKKGGKKKVAKKK